jgi:hypothetical protein
MEKIKGRSRKCISKQAVTWCGKPMHESKRWEEKIPKPNDHTDLSCKDPDSADLALTLTSHLGSDIAPA